MKKVLSTLSAVAVIMCATTAQAAVILVDFQATIASEQHPTYAGEARYYHVSVNPSNPGIGSYAATIVGTNNPAPTFVRNFTEDVVSYKWVGGTNNDINGIAAQGGDTARITYTTEDTSFDGYGQGQLKLWTTTDPGADLQTTVNPYTAVADGGGGGYRSFGGAVGTVDISGLATGSVYVFYGSFSAKPTVSAVMKDLDGVAPDITIANAHLNNDTANRTEYYVAELDFVTDSVYDVIEYTWLANGVDYSGNGRGVGTLLTGTESPPPPWLYWDIDGATLGAGGATPGGTWDATTTANWNAASDGTGAAQTWSAGSTAYFAAGGDATGTYTVTVDGTHDIGGLTFEEGTVTLANGSSGALRMISDTVMDVASGLTATVQVPISEDGAGSTPRQLYKTGDGTIILSGANTYTGGTTIAAGNLTISDSGTLGTAADLTLNGGSLDLGGTSQIVGDVSITTAAASGDTIGGGGDLTAISYAVSNATGTVVISSDLAGSGATMTKTGEGTLVLSGSNTYDGLTTVSAGELAISGSGTLGNGDLTLGGGSLNLGGISQTVGAVSITDAAASGDTIGGGGDLTATTYAASNATGTVVISANLLDVAGSTMTKSGAGLLLLTGSNTYSGMTRIEGGALVLEKQSAINGGLTSITPANVAVEAGAALGLGVGDSGSGYFGNTEIDAVLSQMGTSGMAAGAQIGLDTTNATDGTFTRGTPIGNSIGLAKLGEGQLVLDADNTYTGATTVYAGTLTAGAEKTSAFGLTPSLAFGPGSNGKVQLNGNSFDLSSLTTDGGSPIVENASATPVTLTVNNSVANTFAGSLQDGSGGGALSLVKNGDGTLTLSGASSYSGGTVISAGTVVISADNNLGAADSSVSITGTSRINLVGPLTCTHPIDISSGVVLSLQNTNSNTIAEFSGAVTGSGGITAIARGGGGGNVTIALTNPNNTFTGPVVTTHASSTDIFSFASIGDASIISFGKASWRVWVAYTGSTDLTLNTRQLALGATFGGVLDGMGTPVNAFQSNGAGTVTINPDFLVPETINSGTFWFDGSNTGNNTFAGIISNPATSGTLSIGKWGVGKWVFTNANTYSGTTTLRNGTLSISASNNIGDGSATNGLVFSGGTLQITGTALTNMWDLTNSNTRPITFTAAKTIGLDIADALNTFTVDQVLNQTTGGLTKSGAGTLVLSDTNTYTGNTTVNEGTLDVTGSIADSAVTVNNAGTRITGGGTVKSLTINPDAGFTWSFGDGGDYTMDVVGNLSLADNWVIKLVDLGTDPDASLAYDLFIYGDSYTGSAEFDEALTNLNLVIDNTDAPDWDISELTIVAADGYVSITGVGSSALIGDADDNGVVNAADYIILKTHIGMASGATTADGDFDGDGDVDWDDLQILQAHYGETIAGAAGTIPEPATLGLLAIGAVAILRRRR